MATIKPPEGLGSAGQALWKSITKDYEFRPDELAVLEDACRTADIIEAMESAWAKEGRPMTTKGSMGQLVPYPLISELRQHRAARAKLLAQLKIPDAGVNLVGARSVQARGAVNTRWAKRGA